MGLKMKQSKEMPSTQRLDDGEMRPSDSNTVKPAYIVGCGGYLPGLPITNEQIHHYIGYVTSKSEKLKRATLRKNGVNTRHYAREADGTVTHSNAELAALAVANALQDATFDPSQLEFLATATTQGDMLVPGHASLVHAATGIDSLSLASFQSVCASSTMAIQSAVHSIQLGQTRVSAAVGSELSSVCFQPSFYQPFYNEETPVDEAMSLEFLRWTLSDGGAACIFSDRPNPNGVSFKVDWIEQRSFANRVENCMYAGTASASDQKYWRTYSSPQQAYQSGALALKQDFDCLYKLFPSWVGYFCELLDKHQLEPTSVDHFLPHFSAQSLGDHMARLLDKAKALIPRDKWFNNLNAIGNTGSASIFFMLDGLRKTKKLSHGESILCFVPESGRSIASFIKLTVVCNDSK